MEWIKWILALLGHLGLWAVAYNRIHATSLPRSSRKFTEKIIFLMVIIPIVYIATTLISWEKMGVTASFKEVFESSRQVAVGPFGMTYLWICVAMGLYFFGRFFWRGITRNSPKCITSSEQNLVDLQEEIKVPLLHGFVARILGSIPWNQVLKLSTQEMTFTLDVSPKLDGLKICHLSDLHYTGQIGIEYFEKVIERANAFEPDIVVITGDIVDNRECLAWLDSTLGRLKPSVGVFYVLGNHDRRISDEDIYRGRLESLGMSRAAGRWKSVKFNGAEIKITGNELPWYKGAEWLPTDPGGGKGGMKILLSHSPDQIDWAQPYKFDMMFAGHTHGGQICLPFIGPLVAPSRYGVLYAAGTFLVGSTLMHVSRGLSGDEPLRFCCPPELGLFTVRSKNAVAKPAEEAKESDKQMAAI